MKSGLSVFRLSCEVLPKEGTGGEDFPMKLRVLTGARRGSRSLSETGQHARNVCKPAGDKSVPLIVTNLVEILLLAAGTSCPWTS